VSGPLSGLRIVEVSSFVAAPLGGMTLAQLGADVIRVVRSAEPANPRGAFVSPPLCTSSKRNGPETFACSEGFTVRRWPRTL
jgi:crotonobetainyl-CoA:carnitine CoA-transferase CaiB-like acyl-CoA transferase